MPKRKKERVKKREEKPKTLPSECQLAIKERHDITSRTIDDTVHRRSAHEPDVRCPPFFRFDFLHQKTLSFVLKELKNS